MGVFRESDATLAMGVGKQRARTIALFEYLPPEAFVEDSDESLFEIEELSLEEELPELEWVEPEWTEESWTEVDTFDLDSDFEEPFPFPPFDFEWPRESLDLRLSKKILELSSPAALQDPLPLDPIVVQEDDIEEAEPDAARGKVDPLLVEAAPPPYPLIARRRRWEGTALCRILVGTDGSVLEVSIEVSAGHSALDDAAVKAVREWRFRPGTRNGAASEFEVLHKVTFRLDP